MFYKWVLLSLLSTSFAGSHSGWVDSNWLDPSPLTGNMHTVPEHQIDFTNTLIAMNLMPQANHAMRGWLGLSKAGRPVEAWYFPGTSKQRALIVGGMHGSELSSIALANSIIADLQSGPPPYYSVIIIPTLFPDNAAVAEMNPTQLGSVENLGRYTYSGATDPNRQMPTPGKAFDPAAGIDHFGDAHPDETVAIPTLGAVRSLNLANAVALGVYEALRQTGCLENPRLG